MATGKYVAYFRVSTDKQRRSGLGLDAQRAAVQQYLDGGKWQLVAEYTEIETGKRNDRPQLALALALCRLHNATLIVAKLDRLARNTRFLLTLVEESGERGVVFCDLPKIPEGPVGKFFVSQMASVAELEAGLISQRTKAALRAAQARGVKLGAPTSRIASQAKSGAAASAVARQRTARKRAADVAPVIASIRAAGAVTLRDIAAALNAHGIPATRGGKWSPMQVARVLKRI